jgi:hypothetical protein
MPAADDDTGEYTYEEREAVAIFDDERALNSAVDELVQSGLTQADMSLLGHADRLAGKTSVELADSADAPRADFISRESRTEGLAALTAAPALLAGLGVAAVVGTGGAALIPTIAASFGSMAAGGGLGLVLARVFGRRHANRIQDAILRGGLVLWVHAPDPAKDTLILGILTKHGGRDIHTHVVTRSWGIDDVPLHDFQPDPMLKS